MSDNIINLQYPPIIECVCEIKIAPTDRAAHDIFDINDTEFNQYFTKKVDIHLFKGSFDVISGDSNHVKSVSGFFYKSEDEKDIVRFELDGFSYSRLAPYSGWEEFSNFAMKNWNIYKNSYKNMEIRSFGLRFINRIDVGTSFPELTDFFKVSLSAYQENELLNNLKAVAYTYVKCVTSIDALARVNFQSEDEGSFIFDIDITKDNISSGTYADVEVLEFFNAMRKEKNDIFFRTLTEKALERYR